MKPAQDKPARPRTKTARATRADPLVMYDDRWIKACTPTLDRFLSQHKQTLGIFFLMLELVTRIDHVQAVAAQALDDDRKPLDHYKKDVALKRLQEFSSVNSTNLVTNTANNFLCYLSEILQEVVRKRHEILKSSERLTTEEALQFSRFEDLVAFIADRKINELAYGGLRAMSDFVADRLGVELFEDEEKRMLVTILVELRNVQTHNRGIINQLFANRIGCLTYDDFHFKVGERYHVDLDRLGKLARAAIDVAERLDVSLSKKFGLRRLRRKPQQLDRLFEDAR